MTALPVREMSAPKLKNEKLSSFSPQIASMAKDVAIVENSMEDNAEIMQERTGDFRCRDLSLGME